MDRYEEALERAKKGLPIDEVFPELKESEDERIRKALIGHLKAGVDFVSNGVTKAECIAWLEKQKEQNQTRDNALQKAFINSKIDYTLEEKCDASDYAETILPTSVTYGEGKEEYKLHKIIEAAFIAGQKKEQKPVHTAKEMWKEMRLEVYAQASGNRHEPNYSDDSTKMFSLCDIDEIFEKIGDSTVGSQSAEWSEEDENIYNKALDAIYYKDCNEKDDVISALNDLCDLISRKRKVIPPYAHWKPSKEQN